MTLFWKIWFQWEVEICLKYQKFNCYSKTTKCSSQQKKFRNKVTKQLIFQLYKQLMIHYKQEFKELETKVKVKNKIAIKKDFIIDLQQPLFQYQVRATLQLIQWTPFRITRMCRTELIRITIILSFRPMEILILGSMPQQAISFKHLCKMDPD
jgi:hypothetical protein